MPCAPPTIAVMIARRLFLASALAATGVGLAAAASPPHRLRALGQAVFDPRPLAPGDDYDPLREPEPWAARLLRAAEAQIGETVIYDPSYVRLSYPGGDVPRERGVCTDVVIRAFRDGFDVDLQELVHRDMRRHFAAYPTYWGMKRPDRNIDHRRVLNLATYFRRAGALQPFAQKAEAWLPGDIVTQMLPGKRPHIAIVSDRPNAARSRPLVIHNIGAGARLEDSLFEFEITGRYRYRPV